MSARIEPTWPRGMYGCPQDMYGATVVLPLIAQLAASEARVTELTAERTERRRQAAKILNERDALTAKVAELTERIAVRDKMTLAAVFLADAIGIEGLDAERAAYDAEVAATALEEFAATIRPHQFDVDMAHDSMSVRTLRMARRDFADRATERAAAIRSAASGGESP